MKKFTFMLLSVSISTICLAQTHENDSVPTITVSAGDIYEREDASAPIVKVFSPRQTFYLKNGKSKLTHRFFAGPVFGKDDVMSPTFNGNTTEEFSEKISNETEQGTNIGFSLDYRVTMTPGKTSKDLCFTPNPWGFAGSFGFIASGDFQSNYGFSCDVLAALGFEIGTSKIGVGLDGLIGTGNVTGFIIQQHDTDPELSGSFKDSLSAGRTINSPLSAKL